MDTGDKIGLVSGIVSFLSFVGSMIFAYLASRSRNAAKKQADRANVLAENSNLIAMGQAEANLRSAISKERTHVGKAATELSEFLGEKSPEELSESEQGAWKVLQSQYHSEIEDLLNAYEQACSAYLDGKVDKERFKKNYVNELPNLCDPDTAHFAKHMFPEATSRFEAIWKVYREWHKHEK